MSVVRGLAMFPAHALIFAAWDQGANTGAVTWSQSVLFSSLATSHGTQGTLWRGHRTSRGSQTTESDLSQTDDNPHPLASCHQIIVIRDTLLSELTNINRGALLLPLIIRPRQRELIALLAAVLKREVRIL